MISADTNILSPQQLSLTCSARGIPVPMVQWLYSNKSLVEYSNGTSNYTVQIKNFRDAGNYICEAGNKHGHTVKSVDVKVQGEQS